MEQRKGLQPIELHVEVEAFSGGSCIYVIDGLAFIVALNHQHI